MTVAKRLLPVWQGVTRIVFKRGICTWCGQERSRGKLCFRCKRALAEAERGGPLGRGQVFRPPADSSGGGDASGGSVS